MRSYINSLVHPENFSIIENENTSLIKQVIEETKKSFIPGGEIQLRQKISELAHYFHVPFVNNYVSKKDTHFIRNAHLIPDTKLIAATGPKFSEMEEFISDTVYNPHQAIRQVIALGTCTAYNDEDPQDFYDYCLKERDEIFQSYTISIKRLSGTINHPSQINCCYPENIIRSKLVITSKENSEHATEVLNVTLIPISDGSYIDLENDVIDPYSKKVRWTSDQIKEILWKHFQQSLNEPILIHCQQGLGRTGNLILTFEILRNYNDIFACGDPVKIAKNILDLVARIRRDRLDLLLKTDQFISGIYNAYILYNFALEKKYISSIQDKEEKNIPTNATNRIANESINNTKFGIFVFGSTSIPVAVESKVKKNIYSPK